MTYRHTNTKNMAPPFQMRITTLSTATYQDITARKMNSPTQAESNKGIAQAPDSFFVRRPRGVTSIASFRRWRFALHFSQYPSNKSVSKVKGTLATR